MPDDRVDSFVELGRGAAGFIQPYDPAIVPAPIASAPIFAGTNTAAACATHCFASCNRNAGKHLVRRSGKTSGAKGSLEAGKRDCEQDRDDSDRDHPFDQRKPPLPHTASPARPDGRYCTLPPPP